LFFINSPSSELSISSNVIFSSPSL